MAKISLIWSTWNRFISRTLTVFFIFATLGCASDKKVDTESVRKEIESRELKKVTEAQILSKANEIGNTIALQAQKTLGKNLQAALQQGGVVYAIGFCNLNAMPIVDSLSQQFRAEIRRVSSRARNQLDLPDSLELKILEAYEYTAKSGGKLNGNVQSLHGDQYLFSKPIMIENALCLTCHGTRENGLMEPTEELIKSKYPFDKAVGYEMGDFRGMWSIRIPKKAIVQQY